MPRRRANPRRISGAHAMFGLVLGLATITMGPGSQGSEQDIIQPPTVNPPGVPAMDESVKAIVDGNTRFALELYAKLRSRSEGNLFYSPASLSTALAMAYAGARGETATQMDAALHFGTPPEGESIHDAFAALQSAWNPGGKAGYRLSVANRLWGQQGFDFRPAFLAVTRDAYGAELATVDFRTQAEAARGRINTWVEEHTAGKIVDLIPPGALNALTRLVLTNAVYFKGDWSTPFQKEATRDEPFHLADRRKVEVPLMHRAGRYKFWAGEGLKVLELPYGETDAVVMQVFLPDQIEGLPALEARLTPEALARWSGSLRSQQVIVTLPRFKLTSEFELAETLSALGMPRAFSPSEADFTGMSSEEELCLSAVLHKAFVDVNEEGTEAAAATGVLLMATSAQIPREPPPVFRADHPFVFLIRDTRTGSILFLGRLVEPEG